MVHNASQGEGNIRDMVVEGGEREYVDQLIQRSSTGTVTLHCWDPEDQTCPRGWGPGTELDQIQGSDLVKGLP